MDVTVTSPSLSPPADTGPNDEAIRYNRPLPIAAMIAVTNPGSFSMMAAPLLLSAFVRGGMSAAQASALCAGELTGMTLASLVAALLVARADRRALIAGGLALALIGHLTSIIVPGFLPMLAARTLAGFGIGAMFTTAVAGLAGLANPERAFGFSMTTNQLATLLLMMLVAHFAAAGGPSQTVVIVMIMSALMGIAIPFIPARAPRPAMHKTAAANVTRFFPPLLATVGLLAFSTAIGLIWPLVGQIGLQKAIPAPLVNSMIAIAGIGAISGGLTAAAVGLRFGRLPIVALCTACLTIAIIGLYATSSLNGFRVAVLPFLFFWPLSIPYLLGTLATLDPAGRWAALSGAMIPCGMALGGAIAAMVVRDGDFVRVSFVAAPVMAASGALIAAALWSGRRAH
jgi:MFS transporter, DHA1 family, inner membrane transport protein